MSLARPACTVLLLLSALAAPGVAQIDAEDPFDSYRGLPGDEFTIRGTDLPTERVRARLIDPDTNERARRSALKVVDVAPNAVTVRIRRACVGAYQVQLSGRELEEPIVSGTQSSLPDSTPGDILFRVPGPAFETLSDPEAGKGMPYLPGERVQLAVRDLGPRRPRVRLGGRRAKVDRDVGQPSGGVSTVDVRLPRRLGRGTWTVEIETRLGSDRVLGLLTCENDRPNQNAIGRPRLRARIAFRGSSDVNVAKKTERVRARTSRRNAVSPVSGTGALLVAGFSGFKANTRAVDVMLPAALEQADLITSATADTDLTYEVGARTKNGFFPIDAWGGDAWTVSVQAVNEGRVWCAFEGVLQREMGASEPAEAILGGEFQFELPVVEEDG